ncbi:MAG: PQQ-binding-like beta-propeller repeat protein [Verrucomicrobiaceae bacterium]|nr:PQQ-binding-like beta-propeller repeat protein [Verrucomicrobiaceae bacterium]
MKVPLLLTLLLAASLAPAASDTPPDLPIAIASFGAAGTEDGALYFYGGHSGKRHKYNREEVHGDLFRWKPGAEKWETLLKDEPAQGASLVVAADGVIRIGGMAARNEKGAKQDLWSSETAALYRVSDGKWHPLPKLPQRRSSHDSIVCGEKLYVIGGWRLEGEADPVWHDTYLTLDLGKADAKWESHPQPFKRRALAAQAIGTKIYAIGGMTDDEEVTTAVSVLETTTGTWSDGPQLPADKIGGFGFAAVAHEGRVFASGVSGVLLELRGGAWVSIAKLAHPRYFHRLLSGGAGKIIAIGGESREGTKAPPEVIALPAKDSAPLAEEAKKTASTRKASPAPVFTAATKKIESDWPRYQGPRGDGTTAEAGWNTKWPADGPPVLWKAELGKGLASFAVAGDRVFTSGNDGADHDTVFCLDLETGKPVWKHTLDVPTKAHEMSIVPYGPATTPSVADGRVYIISREGDLLCLDAPSGAVKWQKSFLKDFGGKRPVYGWSTSPALHEGRLYLDVGGAAGSNICLDATTGEKIWQTGSGEAGYATPFVSGKQLVLFKGEALELRAVADGRLLARHATVTRDFCNCATPVRSGDLIFISHTGTMGSRVLAWDEPALTELWSEREVGLLFQSGVPVQGHILAFNDSKRGVNDLRLIDLATGSTRWETAEIDKGSAMLCDDGHTLILTSKGELVLARILPDKIDILSRVQVLGGKSYVQPVLAHGRILCRNNDGSVVCLDVR